MPRSQAPSPAQIAEYKRLVRNVVNPRLARIEKYAKSGKPGTKGMTDFAYKKLGAEAKKLGVYNPLKSGGFRVSTKIPKTAKQMSKQIALMKSFTESKSSTLTGLQKVNMKRLASFNRTMRQVDPNWKDFTLQEFDEFWTKVNNGEIDNEFYLSNLITVNKMINETKGKDTDSKALKEAMEEYEKKADASEKIKSKTIDSIKEKLIKSGIKKFELEGLDIEALVKLAVKFI